MSVKLWMYLLSLALLGGAGCDGRSPDGTNDGATPPAEREPGATDSQPGTGTETDTEYELFHSVSLNPYRVAPLAAVIKASHPALDPAEVESLRVVVKCIDDGAVDLSATLDPQSEAFRTNFDVSELLEGNEVGIPVLGLYPDHDNRVLFEVLTPHQRFFGETVITTAPVAGLEGEVVTVLATTPPDPSAGMIYADDRVYDHQGYVRWKGPCVYAVVNNGNILNVLHEQTWLGKMLLPRDLSDPLRWHHDAIGLPNGNIITCIDNIETEYLNSVGTMEVSIGDYVAELDYETGAVVNAWDLRAFLDVDRATVGRLRSDWFHMNSLAYDAFDDSIIVSGRYQGIVKLTRNGIRGETANDGKSLRWILSPHLDWGLAGPEGAGELDPNDYLLTAVDEDGTPYPQEVQDNLAVYAPDPEAFYWPVGQHGVEITHREEGKIRIMTFNNQASFIFDGPGTVDNGSTLSAIGDLSNDRSLEPFSQIVEYEIDEVAMTVRKVWSFGEHQPELYGSFNSATYYVPETGNRIMTSNGEKENLTEGPFNPHVLEVTPEGELRFHLAITNASVSFSHTGRIDLYHPEP